MKIRLAYGPDKLAIQYLHELNIAHRDLKCENILMTSNYNVKLSDFGFARYAVDTEANPILSSTYCGTLLYASPEILYGQPYNPKISDLWSFGVILYVMLNKSLPFEEHNVKLLYDLQMKRKFRFCSEIVNHLSLQVKQLIANLLEPDPMKRCPIEHVINSDWIAMDNRLTVLSPEEIAALSSAFKNPIPHINITIPSSKNKNKIKTVDETQLLNVDEIKPFNENDQPRKSRDTYLEQFRMAADTI